MKYITAIGEALIDFIPEEKGCRLKDVTGFKRVCGGAPANVAAAAALLGGKSRIITKLGKDAFGDYIVDTLNQAGVDTGSVLRTDKANTALAFVALASDGNRDFSFYRNPSADMLLEADEITADMLKDTGILHFCSVDLIEAPVKYAHIKAIELAKSQNAIISFDPNIRLNLWDSAENCVNTIRDFIKYADILIISN
ncbi:MAG: PfkB family carbohydrate kinase, partial [Eubacterium sp.]|nr:PfkB family carbohydrate kinase [Eubacterium sp.]